MVKILAAADLHGSYDIAKKLAVKAVENDVDLVVLAGDLHGMKEGKGEILNPFLERKKRVLFVPGNWDSSKEHEVLKSKAKSIDNYYVTYDGVAFAGIGNSDMKFSLSEDDFDNVKKHFSKMKSDKKVLVSHLHARGSKAEFSGVLGDDILRRAVDKFNPDLLVSAHIHEGEGIEERIGDTRVVQVGRRGRVLEI